MCKASALSLCYCSSPPRWYFSLWGSWLFGPLLYDSHHKWISRAPLWWQIIISIFPAIATPIFFSVRPGPHTYKSSVLHWPTSKELSSFSCNNLFSSQREPVQTVLCQLSWQGMRRNREGAGYPCQPVSPMRVSLQRMKNETIPEPQPLHKCILDLPP